MKPHLKLMLSGRLKLLAPRAAATSPASDAHPAHVKARLELAGTSLRKLAKANGYSHINEVLHRPWVAAERIVARALGTTPEEIWPSRYQRSRDRGIALTRNTDALTPKRTATKKAGRPA